MLRTLLLSTLLFCCITINAQKVNLDSLLKIVNEAKNDSIQIKALIKLSDYSTPKESVIYANQALNVAKQSNYVQGIAMALSAKANIASRQGDIQTALEYYKQTARIYKENEYDFEHSRVHTNIGRTYIRQNKLDSALYYTKSALKTQRALDYKKGVGNCLSNIGIIYRRLGQYDEAFSCLNEALEVRLELGELKDIGISYNNIGNLYAAQSKFELAVEYFLKAKDAYTKGDEPKRVYNALVNLGFVFMDLKQLDKAEKYFKEAEVVAIEMEEKEVLADIYQLLGVLYKRKNLPDKAISAFNLSKDNTSKEDKVPQMKLAGNLASLYIDMGDLEKASIYNKEHLNLAKSVGQDIDQLPAWLSRAAIQYQQQNYKDANHSILNAEKLIDNRTSIDIRSNLLNTKSNVLSKLGKHQLAFKALAKYNELSDSIHQILVSDKVLEIETKYQAEQKELVNQKLQSDLELERLESKNKNYLIGGSIFIFCGSLGYLFFMYKKNEKLNHSNNELAKEKEKVENLIVDTHHRVSNHLQQLVSILNAKGRQVESDEAHNLHIENRSRIEAVRYLHRKLKYTETGEPKIALDEYILKITNGYEMLYHESNGLGVEYILDLDTVNVDLKIASNMGLLVNEVITNSHKYAFHDTEKPVIHISLVKQGENSALLKIRDNGGGMRIGSKQKESLGSSLIEAFVNNIGGHYSCDDTNGTSYSIQIPNLTTCSNSPMTLV